MEKIDFHSHIIPYIDDGAKDTDTAIKILEESLSQGVDAIIATPHFKSIEDDIETFIHRRTKRLKRLEEKAEEVGIAIPKIYKGAEVSVFPGLSDLIDLRALCIENTDYILLEMPYSYWYDAIFDEVYKIIAKRGLIPVIAHVERYTNKKIDWEQYNRLLTMDVVMQFNSVSFTTFTGRSIIKKIIKKNVDIPVVIGSDVHDLGYRKTYYKKSCNIIKKLFGKDFLEKSFLTAENILKNKKKENLF